MYCFKTTQLLISYLSDYLELPKSKTLPVVTFEVVEELMPRLAEEHNIVTAITFFQNKAWIRLSANVYVDKEDYVKLRDGLAKALELEIKTG